jgi:hypothetical protein
MWNLSSNNNPEMKKASSIGLNDRWVVVALLILSTISLAGCAKIAAPRPPEIHIPKAASDLTVRQLSDYVVLAVSKPVLNTDGTEITNLKSVNVLRLTEDATLPGSGAMISREQFLKTAVRILSISPSQLSGYLKNDLLVIEDKVMMAEKSYSYSRAFRYAVLFVNNKNQAAGLSNQVVIKPVPIPEAPADLHAEVTEKAIRLKWTAPVQNMDGSKPPRIEGYNIFRSEDPAALVSTPLNAAPVSDVEFADDNFRFDTTYYYSITTAGSILNSNAQSLPSGKVPVVSRDVFPPVPPENFNAMLEGERVILLWTPSSSSDIAGYTIYRQEKNQGSRVRINEKLITLSSTRDQVDPIKSYVYWIQAVDTHGNESVLIQTELEKRQRFGEQ